MAEQTSTVLLRGGPGDGSTLSGVVVGRKVLDYMGTTYALTAEQDAPAGLTWEPGEVVQLLPVYEARQPLRVAE